MFTATSLNGTALTTLFNSLTEGLI